MESKPKKARKIIKHAGKKKQKMSKAKAKERIKPKFKAKMKVKPAKGKFSAAKARMKGIKISRKAKEKRIDIQEQQRKEILEKYLVSPELRKRLVDTAGENAIPVLKSFRNGSTDEELASKASAKVADIRATLNKLHGIGLVSYKKVRDADSGWYHYTWVMNAEKIKEWAEQKEGVVQEGEFYSCSKCSSGRYSFEEAMDISFRCPQCGSSLDTHHQHK
ncbi:MAG: hypothetical protein QW035_01195 [Candidatus Anstonellales archaeon]